MEGGIYVTVYGELIWIYKELSTVERVIICCYDMYLFSTCLSNDCIYLLLTLLSCMYTVQYVYLPTYHHAGMHVCLFTYFSPCCPVYPPTVFLTMLPCLTTYCISHHATLSIHLLYFSPCCLVYLPYNHSSTRYSVYVQCTVHYKKCFWKSYQEYFST